MVRGRPDVPTWPARRLAGRHAGAKMAKPQFSAAAGELSFSLTRSTSYRAARKLQPERVQARDADDYGRANNATAANHATGRAPRSAVGNHRHQTRQREHDATARARYPRPSGRSQRVRGLERAQACGAGGGEPSSPALAAGRVGHGPPASGHAANRRQHTKERVRLRRSVSGDLSVSRDTQRQVLRLPQLQNAHTVDLLLGPARAGSAVTSDAPRLRISRAELGI